MQYTNAQIAGVNNNYRYNGKELQEDKIGNGELDWYDYGARMYAPAIGRWHVVDPMAESYLNQSPYHFSGNNPIYYIDYNGMNYDGYTIDDEGYINRVNDTGGDEYDVLYTENDYNAARLATKEDGTLKNEYGNAEPVKSVSVTKGSFDNEVDIDPIAETGGGCSRKKVIGEGEGYQMGNSDAAKVFKFASDNSAIEFGLIDTKNSGSVVLTNHTVGKIRASSTAEKMDNGGKTITRITHNHPRNSDPSPSDKTNAGNFPKSQGQNIGYNVYQPGNKMVVGYDKNDVVFRIKSSFFFGN